MEPIFLWIALAATLVWSIPKLILSLRPPLPVGTPKLIRKGLWPIFGTVRFFTDRYRFCVEGAALSRTGNFSFYIGNHRVVKLGGVEGRKFYWENKDLTVARGFISMFKGRKNSSPPSTLVDKMATAPMNMDSTKEEYDINNHEDFARFFRTNLTRAFRRESLARILHSLTSATLGGLEDIVAQNGGASSGFLEPFGALYNLVFELNLRSLGVTEITTPQAMVLKREVRTLIDARSPLRMMFQWLPTLGYLTRLKSGLRIYDLFAKVVEQRKKSDRREDDMLQDMIDSGGETPMINRHLFGTLMAGQVNTGWSPAYFLFFLSNNHEWKSQVQGEIDSVISRHRVDPTQKAVDILNSLTVENWETEFPQLELCLRETVRFQLTGSLFRKNDTGRDIPIGDSGELFPADAYAVYEFFEVHFNPEIYTDPWKFDPGRYLPDRAEDKKVPYAYAGWGLGRHVCLGMKLAKLEITLVVAYFMTVFDYELVDSKGNPTNRDIQVERDLTMGMAPKESLRLKYHKRVM